MQQQKKNKLALPLVQSHSHKSTFFKMSGHYNHHRMAVAGNQPTIHPPDQVTNLFVPSCKQEKTGIHRIQQTLEYSCRAQQNRVANSLWQRKGMLKPAPWCQQLPLCVFPLTDCIQMILPVLQAFIKQKCLSDILPTESPGLNDAEAPCIYTGPLQGRSPVYVFEE